MREPVSTREKALFAAVIAERDDALVALAPVYLRGAATETLAVEPVHEPFVVLECSGLVVELALFAFWEIPLEKRLEATPVV